MNVISDTWNCLGKTPRSEVTIDLRDCVATNLDPADANWLHEPVGYKNDDVPVMRVPIIATNRISVIPITFR